jgi:molecular chaperone DnaK
MVKFSRTISKTSKVVNPENTFFRKRFIGCKFEEIEAETNRISYKVRKGDNGK